MTFQSWLFYSVREDSKHRKACSSLRCLTAHANQQSELPIACMRRCFLVASWTWPAQGGGGGKGGKGAEGGEGGGREGQGFGEVESQKSEKIVNFT